VYKRLIFLAVIGLWLTTGWVLSGQLVEKTITVYFGATDTTVDTAMAISFSVSQGLDSFKYIDTFVTGSAAVDSTAVSWTSGVQTMIWTLGTIDATPTLLDTVAIGVVGCTLTLAGGDKGIEYDLSTGDDATLATALDSFCAIWAAVPALKDSVYAQDSGTYIKFVSRFSEVTFTAEWTVKMSTDSTDTTGYTTEIWHVCDSMSAALNTAIGTALTSSVDTNESGVVDSFIVVSDDPGLVFTVYFGDSVSDNADTVHGQLNVTSYSGHTDTIEGLMSLVTNDRGSPNLYPEIISIDLSAADDTLAGFGDADSGYLWLYTVFEDEYHLIACDTVDSLPVNLRKVYAGPVADSLFKSKLALVWRVADSVSDTIINGITFDIDVDCLLGPK